MVDAKGGKGKIIVSEMVLTNSNPPIYPSTHQSNHPSMHMSLNDVEYNDITWWEVDWP